MLQEYFFKADHNLELQRWLTDLTWRVKASEKQIEAQVRLRS